MFITLLLVNLIILFPSVDLFAQASVQEEGLSNAGARIVSVDEINQVARNNYFLDPSFHNYIEINYGYLRPGAKESFRDALSVLPREGSTTKLESTVHKVFADVPVKDKSLLGTLHPAKTIDSRIIFNFDDLKTQDSQLLYKVMFVGENSPLAGFVPPLNYSVSEGSFYQDYVFVHIKIKGQDYSKLVDNLSKNSDFRFVGYKTIEGLKGNNQLLILGWIPYAHLRQVYGNSRVIEVSVEKNPGVIPFKIRVDFILKIPYDTNPEKFTASFLNYAKNRMKFLPERITKPSGHFLFYPSRFTGLNISGNLPVNKVLEILKSPFVTNLKVQKSSL